MRLTIDLSLTRDAMHRPVFKCVTAMSNNSNALPKLVEGPGKGDTCKMGNDQQPLQNLADIHKLIILGRHWLQAKIVLYDLL